MDRKPAAVNIVRFLAEQVEELSIGHTDEEIESAVCITHDQEQRCFLIPEGIQLLFVIGRQLPELLDIEYGKPCPAGDKDAFRRFPRYLELLFKAQGAEVCESEEEADIVLVMGKAEKEKEVSIIDANFFMT